MRTYDASYRNPVGRRDGWYTSNNRRAGVIRNRFEGTCRACSTQVQAGAGVAQHVHRIRGSRWDVYHLDCFGGNGDAIAARRQADVDRRAEDAILAAELRANGIPEDENPYTEPGERELALGLDCPPF